MNSRMIGSIPGLYPLDSSSMHRPLPPTLGSPGNVLQMLLSVPGGWVEQPGGREEPRIWLKPLPSPLQGAVSVLSPSRPGEPLGITVSGEATRLLVKSFLLEPGTSGHCSQPFSLTSRNVFSFQEPLDNDDDRGEND